MCWSIEEWRTGVKSKRSYDSALSWLVGFKTLGTSLFPWAGFLVAVTQTANPRDLCLISPHCLVIKQKYAPASPRNTSHKMHPEGNPGISRHKKNTSKQGAAELERVAETVDTAVSRAEQTLALLGTCWQSLAIEFKNFITMMEQMGFKLCLHCIFYQFTFTHLQLHCTQDIA